MTSPPSPTKHALPHVYTHFIAIDRATGEDDASSEASTPRPFVRSLISINKSLLSSGFKMMSAPNSIDLSNPVSYTHLTLPTNIEV
mgnify:CR=1 FL=1